MPEHALRDPHPAVREHAVRLSEPFLRPGRTRREFGRERRSSRGALLARVADPELRVRYQLAFTLGEWPDPRRRPGPGPVSQAADPDQPQLLTAVLSSAVPHVEPMIETILREYPDRPPVALFQQLLSLGGAPGTRRSL